MMLSFYRLAESPFIPLLNFLPFLALALYRSGTVFVFR